MAIINGRYQLIRPLGDGGSATVFECLDLQGNIPRALKVLHERSDEALLRSEFIRLSTWSHPHLVRVHDLDRLRARAVVGQCDLQAGRLFLVMDLVRGEDPIGAISQIPAGERDARLRRIAGELAFALAFLHGHSVLHYDVKPTNVLLAADDGRAVLLDLGLAAMVGTEAARGTLLYMAPEALSGSAEPRSDLWSLGATLFHLATGHPPFTAAGVRLVRQILEEQPELDPTWMSADLRQLILSLLRKDPARRPAAARSVLAELARSQGDHRAVAELSSRPELLPPSLVGRQSQLAALEAALQGGTPRLIILCGAPGAGKSRLMEEAVRRHRLAAAAGRATPLSLLSGDLHTVLGQLRSAELPTAAARWLDGAEPGVNVEQLGVLLADFVRSRRPEAREVLHLTEADGEPVTVRLLQAMGAATDGTSSLSAPVTQLVVEVETGSPRALVGADTLVVELPLLDREQVAALVGSMLGRVGAVDLVDRLGELSQGNPGLLIELIRQWHQGGVEALELARPELAALLARRRSRLPPALRALMDALAIWEQPATVAELAALLEVPESQVWPSLEELAHRGEVVVEQSRARLLSKAHAGAWAGSLDAAEALPLHARAARLLEGAPAAPTTRPLLAWHLLRSGAPSGPEAGLRAARELCARHAPLLAIRLLEQVVTSGVESITDEARHLLAELYLQTGGYAQALALLTGTEPAELLLRAQVLLRSGDYPAAEKLLRELVPRLMDEEQRLQACASLARLELQSGRPVEASASLEAVVARVLALPVEQALSAGAAACLEVAGFALVQRGLLNEADKLFARGELGLQGSAPARLARFVDFRGMVAFANGELPLAASHYRRALELVGEAGDLHGRATYLCNLGSTLILTGRYGEALTHLTAALHELERLARNTEVASSYCNLSNLLLQLGDLDQATKVRERGLVLATQLGSTHTQAHLAMLDGDLRRRGGQGSSAATCYQEAALLFEQAGAVRELVPCALARADTLAELGESQQAGEILISLRPDENQQGPWATSWARLYLATAGGVSIPEDIERALVRHCAALEKRGAVPELWRVAAVLGRLLLLRGRRGAARNALRRARANWEVIVNQAPDLYRERMSSDPDARALMESWAALLEEGEEQVEGSSSSAAPVQPLLDADRLRRLVAINKRLNSELRLPRLLELIMDTVTELTGAERGFLLLVESEDRLSIKVARNIDQRTLEGDELSLSRSIAERAARTGVPVVTVDAAADGRFMEALSVSDLHLRSVLAVPLRVKGSTVGTIYVDNRLRQGLFGEAEVSLVQDLADQAAIAIDNARLLAENRRRQREIEQLNQKLRRRVQSQQAELLQVREELRSSREIWQQRKDYHGIVGRSARMRELFHLLDRVVETELPVVVEGESGTGKELVARAIHQHGRRAGRPFVSENCAAIPETLLESVLFGHVRGAFTGADRERKGLFEVASGGTLFLDEVGEMSPAMQTKLLRVLQDGEFRRVGGAQALRTDVRVIAASNRELAALVSAGRFREDLFYRLNVIRIVVPPLRERREDIPLLVQHFLVKHSLPERRISPEAMALLVGHAWPGNVRELENEILRAAALAGATIDPYDLSPPIAGAVPLSVSGADESNLKLRVEHLERELVQRVLEDSGGNHTQAAQRLGLSRFGLLKKLKRYGIAPRSSPGRSSRR